MSALFFADLIRETTTSTGTGPLSLEGAPMGYRTFAAVVPSDTEFHYSLVNPAVQDEWEVGIGSIGGDGRLNRSVLTSSNANDLVVLTSGAKIVTLTVASQWFGERDDKSDHNHPLAQIDGLGAALDAKQPTGDYAASDHDHAMSDVVGLQSALDGKQPAGDYAAAAHDHGIADVDGLAAALDGKQPADNYALAVHSHDYLSDAPSDGGQYARRDGTWSLVENGGGAPTTAMPDGTTAAPGWAFAADPGTGFHRPGDNQLSVVAGADEKVRFTETGVGFGTTPTCEFHFKAERTTGLTPLFIFEGGKGAGGGAVTSFTRPNEILQMAFNFERPGGNYDGWIGCPGGSASRIYIVSGNGGGGNGGIGVDSTLGVIFGVGFTGGSYNARIDKSGNAYFASATTASAANVHQASSGGVLLRSTSSLRYKTAVEDMEARYADAILGCRPIWYRSLAEADNPAWGYWGLIAEEVAEIDPRLVHYAYPPDAYEDVEVSPAQDAEYDDEGKLTRIASEAVVEKRLKPDAVKVPDGVQYDRLVVPLLDIVQRQQEAIAALTARIDALEVA